METDTKIERPTGADMMIALLAQWEASDRTTGLTWYTDARREARRMARAYGVTTAAACGVIAALSPQVQWVRNLTMAREILRDGVTTGQTSANLTKAYRIADGARPLTVLGGPKVRAFYRALMGDESAAVIDTWMMVAAQWHRDGATALQYLEIARALTDAAAFAGIAVAPFQAVVWTHVRGSAD